MDINDLIKNIRTFFLKQYQDSLNEGASFLAFEPLGHPVSPDDFKFEGSFNETVAAEQLSLMADDVPQISDLFIPDALNNISDAYSILLNSARLYEKDINAADLDSQAGLFGMLLNKAVQAYKSQASIANASDSIYLCKGNPTGWWDKDSAIWTHKSFKESDFSSTSSGPATGVDNKLNMVWKLNAIDDRIKTIVPVHRILIDPVIMSRIQVAHIEPATIATQPAPQRMAIATTVARPVGATTLIRDHRSSDVHSMQSTAGGFQTDRSSPQPSGFTLNKASYLSIRNTLAFSQLMVVNRAIGQNDNSATQTVDSKEFTMEFDFAMIELDRPWIYGQLLQESHLWYVLGHKSGDFSSGEKSAFNTGMLRSIPKAMIVIKELTITAQWSEEDKHPAGSAMGLGSFNITNSSFDGNTLKAPGIQILGWICEAMPKLPQHDDPNLPPVT